MMLQTKNDLPEDVRSRVSEILNRRVADAIDLVYQSKQAHWNVKGMHFRGLHKLFDKVAERTEDQTDLLAERVVQLGSVVKGTIQAASKLSSLDPYPLDVLNGEQHVELVSSRLAQFAKNLRGDVETCEGLGDAVTVDILTEVVRDVDEMLWMTESHLQSDQSVIQERRERELRQVRSG